MSVRTTRRTVTFEQPFVLGTAGAEQPAGSYVVETDEQLLEGFGRPAYRRIATAIFLAAPDGSTSMRSVSVDPLDLEAAERRDASRARRTAEALDGALEAEPPHRPGR